MKHFKEMKLNLITKIAMIVISIVLIYGELTAQSKEYTDIVILKNGTVLNEVKAEESVAVTTADGKTTVYNKDEISEVKKGAITKEPEKATDNWSGNLGYMNWEDAKEKCASQKMRLPSLDELKAAQASKATDSWKKEGYLYWSITPNTSESPFLLYAFTGEIYSLNRFANSYVRCIR